MYESATSVPTIQSWVEGTDFVFCDTAVDGELMSTAKRVVSDNTAAYFQGALDHLGEYRRNYEYLIDGGAAKDVDDFIAAKPDFEAFVEEIAKYRGIAKEIMALTALKQFPLVRLDCEELKRGLAKETENHAKKLLRKVADDYLQVCLFFFLVGNRDKSRAEPDEISYFLRGS